MKSFRGKRRALQNTETMLLVDDRESQVAEPPVPMIYETTSLLRLVWGRGGFDG